MQTLNPAEISQAQAIIDRTPEGVYELSVLYGCDWAAINSPTTFGGKFKRAVEAHHLKLIEPSALKTNNHHTYKILKNPQ